MKRLIQRRALRRQARSAVRCVHTRCRPARSQRSACAVAPCHHLLVRTLVPQHRHADEGIAVRADPDAVGADALHALRVEHGSNGSRARALCQVSSDGSSPGRRPAPQRVRPAARGGHRVRAVARDAGVRRQAAKAGLQQAPRDLVVSGDHREPPGHAGRRRCQSADRCISLAQVPHAPPMRGLHAQATQVADCLRRGRSRTPAAPSGVHADQVAASSASTAQSRPNQILAGEEGGLALNGHLDPARHAVVAQKRAQPRVVACGREAERCHCTSSKGPAPGLVAQRVAVALADLVAMHRVDQEVVAEHERVAPVMPAAPEDAAPGVEAAARTRRSRRSRPAARLPSAGTAGVVAVGRIEPPGRRSAGAAPRCSRRYSGVPGNGVRWLNAAMYMPSSVAKSTASSKESACRARSRR